MVARSTVASIRFGLGFRAGRADSAGAAGLLDELDRPDPVEAAFPLAPLAARAGLIDRRRKARRAAGDSRQVREEEARRMGRVQALEDVRALFQRAVDTRQGFRARLTAFWADHFTVEANGPLLSVLVPDMIESAIRPHVAGRFADLLTAAVFHPAMLIYLNQVQSVGPESRAGRRRDRGLNENLAREVLELHTLGVDAGYTQSDVRALAALLTGLSVDRRGFRFRPAIADPGPMTVLGRQYRTGRASLDDIRQVLSDIAVRPETARHLARKLLVHFVGAPVPEDLVARMAGAYLASGGQLGTLYAAMLEDSRVWRPPFRKVKPPFEFMVSALRAAGIEGRNLAALAPRDWLRDVVEPLAAMGQPLFRPGGPDGWPESAEAWVTPSALSARLQWAGRFVGEALPEQDPRGLLEGALADAASAELRFVVAGAETRRQGSVLVLASPDFNRR